MRWNKDPVVVSPGEDVVTEPAPIPASWIISGNPQARAATLSRSPDGTALTVIWECTKGVFRWRFGDDETVHITHGAVSVHWNGIRYQLKAGDSAFFPAGTVATWIVHERVRKVAFIRIPPPASVGLAIRAWRKLLRMATPWKRRTNPIGSAAPQSN